MKGYYYNNGKAVFGSPIPRNAITIPSLSFVNAIHQARLLDYHLDYLTESDMSTGSSRDTHNDINYTVEECNTLVELLKKVPVLFPNRDVASYAPVGKENYPQVPGVSPGTFSLTNYYSENSTDFRDIKVENVDPTRYGDFKEDAFLVEFSKTNIFKDLFLRNGLDIVKVANGGVIENFCWLGITVCPRPDFAVIKTSTKEVVGFVEHKARTGSPTTYNNIFDTDVMQAAMYSLLPTGSIMSPRCWLVQNYSSSKYVLAELDREVITSTISGITSQYHRLALDIAKRNISSPEGIAYAQLANTREHDYWRRILLCHIVNKSKDASSYIHKHHNITGSEVVRDENYPRIREYREHIANQGVSQGIVWTVGEGGWLLKNGTRSANAGIPGIAVGKVVDPKKKNYIDPKSKNTLTRDFQSMDDGVPDGWIQFYPVQHAPLENVPFVDNEAHKAISNVVDSRTVGWHTVEGDAPDFDHKHCPLSLDNIPVNTESFRFGEYYNNAGAPPYSLDDSLNHWNYERDNLWLPYYVHYKKERTNLGFSAWRRGWRDDPPPLVAWERRHSGSSGMENCLQNGWLQHRWYLQWLWLEAKRSRGGSENPHGVYR